MAVPPPRLRAALNAVAAPAHTTRRYGLQRRLGLLPLTRSCVADTSPSSPVAPCSRNSVVSSTWRQLHEEHQLLKGVRQGQQQRWNDDQVKKYSSPTGFGRQRDEHRKECQFFPLEVLHFSPVRYAPKRRTGSAGVAGAKTPGPSTAAGTPAGAGHIFNIYKDIQEDHTLLPYDSYPAWLLDLEKPEKSYGELAFTFLYGMGIESATLQDYMRFTRLHTKNIIKLNNMRLKKARRSSVKPVYYDV